MENNTNVMSVKNCLITFRLFINEFILVKDLTLLFYRLCDRFSFTSSLKTHYKLYKVQNENDYASYQIVGNFPSCQEHKENKEQENVENVENSISFSI